MKIKKIILLIVLLLTIVCFSTLTLKSKVGADAITFNIKTINKKYALNSVANIFDTYCNNPLYLDELYKLYLFSEDLNYSSNLSQSQIQSKLSFYNINFTNTSIGNDTYFEVKITKEYIYDMNSSLYLNSAFGFNYEHIKFKLYTCMRVQSGTLSIGENAINVAPPIYEEVPRTIYSSSFYRYFDVSQDRYGYLYDYNPSIEIDYKSDLSSLRVSKIRLIDNDKLIVYNEDTANYVFITRDQHYSRNQYQPTFPTSYSSFDLNFRSNNNYTMYDNLGAYFHQLGLYDGDESNLNNLKFVSASGNIMFSESSYEVVYSGTGNNGTKVTNSLVLGTFNFYDSGGILFRELHWYYDVYPYLIWGNSKNDNSNFLERFIWDYGSTHLKYDWRKQRGDTLHSNYGELTQLSIQEINMLTTRLE